MENNNNDLSAQDEQNLFEAYSVSHDPAIRNELTERNLGLVRAVARGYRYDGIEFDDLVSEGCIGLMKAIEKYDFRLGYRFSTYAVYWIKNFMQRYIINNSCNIRIPAHVQERLYKVKKFIGEYQNKNGCEPELHEIAEEFGLSESEIELYISTSGKTASLQKSIGEDSELCDVIAGDEITLEETYENIDRDNAVLRAVNTFLTDREKFVISKRFGLFGSDVMTLTELGNILGMTREGVRLIQVKALKKLRTGLTGWGYSNGRAA